MDETTGHARRVKHVRPILTDLEAGALASAGSLLLNDADGPGGLGMTNQEGLALARAVGKVIRAREEAA